jgi:hypothetical protein
MPMRRRMAVPTCILNSGVALGLHVKDVSLTRRERGASASKNNTYDAYCFSSTSRER